MDGYLELDQLIAAVPAHWVWKDDTNTLELVSLSSSADAKGKVRHTLDPLNQVFQDNSKTGISGHSIVILRKAISDGKVLGNVVEAQKSEGRRTQHVTLENIKKAAFLLLEEKDSGCDLPIFQQMLGTRHLNEFLKMLLNYFSAFLAKYDLESKPGTFVTALEQIEMANADAKMELAQKLMAQIYSKLLLGLDMVKQHHMACGKRPQSKRPPINKILNQRSPVLQSLLQTPREKSEYLFKQHRVNPHFNIQLAEEKTKVVHLEGDLSDVMGIIGEPLSNFFSDKLIPIEFYMENEGTKEHEEEVLVQKSGYSYTTAIDSSIGDMNSSQQYMDMSRATTVGVGSEYDL
ncbi:protein phosphatase 1 regulatory subunit 36 [Mustelus asterias]